MSNLEQSKLRLSRITEGVRSLFSADETSNVNIDGLSVPSLSKQISAVADKKLEEHLQVVKTGVLSEITIQAQAADTQASIATSAANAAAENLALVAAEKGAVDTQVINATDLAAQALTHANSAKSSAQVNRATIDSIQQVAVTVQNALNESQTTQEATNEQATFTNLRAKAADVQALLATLAACEIESARLAVAGHANSADNSRFYALSEANRASQISQHINSQKTLIDNQTATVEQLTTTASEDAELAKTAIDNQVVRAEEAAGLAEKISATFDSSTVPGVGKVPIARGDKQISEDWLNNELAYSTFVIEFANATLDRFSKGKQIAVLSDEINSLTQRLDNTLSQLDNLGGNGNQDLPADSFDGIHAANSSHSLPVFNMVERGWLSNASYQEGMAELIRMQGASGIAGTRQYTGGGFELGERVTDVSYAALNIHNHPNYQSQPGMAEVSACINGYYFRTRHNDYRNMYPVQGNYLAREYLNAPSIPASVLAMPTGVNEEASLDFTPGTQAEYFKNIKSDNKQDCIWHLSYLECWIETLQADNFDDPADSFRHANDGDSLKKIFDKGRYLNASGHKNRLENIPYQPMRVSYVDEFGVPQFGVLKYRINTYPVATLEDRGGVASPRFIVGNSASHYHELATTLTAQQMSDLQTGAISELVLVTSTVFSHQHDIKVTWNGTRFNALDLHPAHQHPVTVIQPTNGKLPFDKAKAIVGTIDNTNRFRLVRDLRSRSKHDSWQSLIDSRMARFECADLESLCEKLPGMQGEGAFLTEEYNQYGLNDTLQNNNGELLNAAYYNRSYKFNRNDASGRVNANRGYNDPTLFVAKNTHTKVLGGFSWMIPLELLLRTPREHWNPYQLPEGDHAALRSEDAAGKGTSSASPFSGTHIKHFFYGTPKSLFADIVSPTDAADTTDSAWVADSNGTARLVNGNGIRVHDIDGMRQRYPVYPVHFDYSAEATQRHWLKDSIKDLFKKAASGTLTINDVDDIL